MLFCNVFSRALLGAAIVALSSACNVFDENLVPEPGTTGVRLGEDCLATNAPQFFSENIFVDIDTSNLTNDRDQLSCVGQNAQGNDGFFAVEMTQGKKWHFHIKVTSGTTADPTVYVLDSGCQDSVCQRGWGLNECLPGQDEHFSFFPPRSGRYFVAVDTIGAGGEPMEILAVQPECGNGEKEHSETCEVEDPGCDSQCRQTLALDARETEPNDEPLANANVLVFDDETARIAGTVGGKCDFDSFAVTVPAGGILSASVSGDCSYDLSLELIRPDGFTPLPGGSVETDAGTCPMIPVTAPFASEGVYFLRLTTQTQDTPTPLEYGLEVQVTTLP